MSCAWRAALCHSSLTQPFLPHRQKLSGPAALPWPKCKAVGQGPASSILPLLFLLPTAPEGRGATSSWEGLQWSILLPCSPPMISLWSASNILLSKTDVAWRSLGLVSPWEDTSQLGTIWSPSGPTLCSKQGFRSWCGFAVSMDLCHPNFLLCPSSLRPAGLTLPVSKYKDAGVARCVL